MTKRLFIGLTTGVFFFGMVGMAAAVSLVSQGLGNGAYTSSSSWSGNSPALAFDGNFGNMWNSGTWPGSWIEVNLGDLTDVRKLILSVEQLPTPATTTHQVWTSSSSILGNTSGATLSHTFSGQTYDGQLLSVDFSAPLMAQYIQIKTTASPSWVAWNEIQVMAADPVPEPASLLLFGTAIAGLAGSRLRRKDR